MKTNIITKVWLSLFGEFEWRGRAGHPAGDHLLPALGAVQHLRAVELGARDDHDAFDSLGDAARPRRDGRRKPRHRTNSASNRPAQRNYRQWTAKRRLRAQPASSFALAGLVRAFTKGRQSSRGRGLALRRVERWLRDRQDADGSWGGIMLPWISTPSSP